MKRQEEIVLHLESADQLLEPCPPSPFLKRRLREDAEKFIIERTADIPRGRDVELVLCFPESEIAKAERALEAIHRHFAFRRDEADKEVRRLRRRGWRTLLIAFAFLGLMMLLVGLIKHYIPAGSLSTVLQEGLTILGWIALWRPGELLLYEWYPFKRDARIFSKLERGNVQIMAEAKT